MFIFKTIFTLGAKFKISPIFAGMSENLRKFFYHVRVTPIFNNLERLRKGNLSFPRKDKKNPWHAVDLEPFIIKFTKKSKNSL